MVATGNQASHSYEQQDFNIKTCLPNFRGASLNKNHCKTLIALDSVYFTQEAKYEAPDMSYYCNRYYT